MKIAIIGYSGHSYGVIESILELGYSVIGYFDKTHKNVLSKLEHLGRESHETSGYNIFICIGDNIIRRNVYFETKDLNNLDFYIKDPTSYVSVNSVVKHQTYVGKRAIINSNSTIGIGCIINTGSIIEHDCNIGDFTHIAPSATICGNVTIGNNCFVGANSTIIPGIKIGDNVIIGAGSVVNRNLESNYTYVGNPIRKL